MKAPIDAMMDRVDWTPIEVTSEAPNDPGLPYATHQGKLTIGPCTIRCYRLNDGRAILDAEDVHRMLGDWGRL